MSYYIVEREKIISNLTVLCPFSNRTSSLYGRDNMEEIIVIISRELEDKRKTYLDNCTTCKICKRKRDTETQRHRNTETTTDTQRKQQRHRENREQEKIRIEWLP